MKPRIRRLSPLQYGFLKHFLTEHSPTFSVKLLEQINQNTTASMLRRQYLAKTAGGNLTVTALGVKALDDYRYAQLPERSKNGPATENVTSLVGLLRILRSKKAANG